MGLHHGGLPAGLSSRSAGNTALSVTIRNGAGGPRRMKMWDMGRVCVGGTRNCRVGAWGPSNGEREPSSYGPVSPFLPPALESGEEESWVWVLHLSLRSLSPGSARKSRAVRPPGVPREVYLFLSPRPSLSSPLAKPPWPPGCTPGGTGEPVPRALLPPNGGFSLAGPTYPRMEAAVGFSFKPLSKINIQNNTSGLSVDPQPAFFGPQFSPLALRPRDYINPHPPPGREVQMCLESKL